MEGKLSQSVFVVCISVSSPANACIVWFVAIYHGGLRRRHFMHDEASWHPHAQNPPVLLEEEELRFMLPPVSP